MVLQLSSWWKHRRVALGDLVMPKPVKSQVQATGALIRLDGQQWHIFLLRICCHLTGALVHSALDQNSAHRILLPAALHLHCVFS